VSASQERESLFAFEVLVRETLTHRVYVNATSKSDARTKARDTANWVELDFSEAAPIVAKSARKIGDPL
jgi:hypothetical protein